MHLQEEKPEKACTRQRTGSVTAAASTAAAAGCPPAAAAAAAAAPAAAAASIYHNHPIAGLWKGTGGHDVLPPMPVCHSAKHG